MSAPLRSLRTFASLAVTALLLSACSTNPFSSLSLSPSSPAEAPPPPMASAPPEPVMPASIRPEEVVGRWGYGSYHNDADRARTEAAARGQCGQAVVINRGPGGGVMMYLADTPQLQELMLKGSSGGRNYIGPPGPSGGMQDREVVSFDGRTLILRWVNPEVQGRYGTGVFVRCAPEGMARRSSGAH